MAAPHQRPGTGCSPRAERVGAAASSRRGDAPAALPRWPGGLSAARRSLRGGGSADLAGCRRDSGGPAAAQGAPRGSTVQRPFRVCTIALGWESPRAPGQPQLLLWGCYSGFLASLSPLASNLLVYRFLRSAFL